MFSHDVRSKPFDPKKTKAVVGTKKSKKPKKVTRPWCDLCARCAQVHAKAEPCERD